MSLFRLKEFRRSAPHADPLIPLTPPLPLSMVTLLLETPSWNSTLPFLICHLTKWYFGQPAHHFLQFFTGQWVCLFWRPHFLLSFGLKWYSIQYARSLSLLFEIIKNWSVSLGIQHPAWYPLLFMTFALRHITIKGLIPGPLFMCTCWFTTLTLLG